jgi:hypothetical protein
LRFYPAREAMALDLALVTRLVLEKLLEWLALDAAARAVWVPPVLVERAWQPRPGDMDGPTTISD